MRKKNPTRRVHAMIAASILLVTLVGCVAIPTSGPATQGLALNAGTGSANFEFNPEGPEKGAKPSSILTGFVAAFTSATGGYAVAKQYLTATFAQKWDPRQSVQVRSGVPRQSDLDSSNTISYSFTAVATIDSAGSYRETTQAATMQFTFAKQRGEWRISEAPSGIVLPSENFQRIFGEQAIYFFDPTSERLVPDVRWFPTGTAPTRIVAALLAGPPPWLTRAVRTEFPEGTRLSDSGSVVTVDAGVAKIDLTKEALQATPKERDLMHLQLVTSLSLVPSISSVSISVEGTPLAIDPQGADAPEADSKVDSQALVYRKGDLGFYANGRIAELPQLSDKVPAVQPVAATISSDGHTLAVLGSQGVYLVKQTAPAPLLVDPRPNLIAPSMDEYGYVWSAPGDNANALHAFDFAGAAHPVAGSLPTDSRIVSLEVSRDGARVAILLSTATGPRLIVTAIVRDPDQKQAPVSLGAPIIDVPLPEGEAVDVTWVDQLTVATLVDTGAQSAVESFTIGGQHNSLGTLPPSISIVGGNGLEGVRILSDNNTIWTYRGSSWQSSKVVVDFIGTQR